MMYVNELEEMERRMLKPYACFSDCAVRNRKIQKHPYRTDFQRDRDRIMHSKAFRRLEYKTQVYLSQDSDHLRTRLTHSLEVSQLSRSIALQLGLNCDLVEAIALGHDVGHTPFGHAGERALIGILKEYDIHTFKHNSQSVRVLDLLEKKYSYDGLELSIQVKEGIFKHTELPKQIPTWCENLSPDRPYSVTLEGQVVAIADEIAQISHDMDDYLRHDILKYPQMLKHKIFLEVNNFLRQSYDQSIEDYLQQVTNDERKKETMIRCLVDYLVTNLITDSQEMLDKNSGIRAGEIEDVYIGFGSKRHEIIASFQNFLNKKILSDEKVKEMDLRGKMIVEGLFRKYFNHPETLPMQTLEKYRACGSDEKKQVQVISDHISGMTDRYAIQQYNLWSSGL